MKLLILGGTKFVGRHIAEAALARGHELTLLTRGQTNANLFAGNLSVEHLRADRSSAEVLTALLAKNPERFWDAVIDVSGYFPRDVRLSTELLKDRAAHYLFISTISVYKDFSRKYMSEDSPTALIDSPEEQTAITGENYGALKAICEQAVAEAFGPGRSTIIRPGLVVGPYDHTNRFVYWPMRVARGGEVLAPGTAGRAVQFIDGRDLANFTLHLLEQQISGIYNATGPSRQLLSMREFLELCRATLGGEATFTWVSDWLLLEHSATPYTEIPLWIPEAPDTLGAGFVNTRYALAAGLAYRPLTQTIADTYQWALDTQLPFPPGKTLTPERERRLLLAWHRLSHPFRG